MKPGATWKFGLLTTETTTSAGPTDFAAERAGVSTFALLRHFDAKHDNEKGRWPKRSALTGVAESGGIKSIRQDNAVSQNDPIGQNDPVSQDDSVGQNNSVSQNNSVGQNDAVGEDDACAVNSDRPPAQFDFG